MAHSNYIQWREDDCININRLACNGDFLFILYDTFDQESVLLSDLYDVYAVGQIPEVQLIFRMVPVVDQLAMDICKMDRSIF